MMSWVLGVLVLLGVGSVLSQVPHSEGRFAVYTDTDDYTADVVSDGEGLFYADFNKGETVMTLPEFADPFTASGFYAGSAGERALMKNSLAVFMQWEKDLPEVKEPPVVSLYPKEDVELGVSNSLVCLVNQFVPPAVKVRWTRNDQEVTEGARVGRYFTNSDETFYMFATLDFTPQEGDVYSCSVEHVALETPETRMWEHEVTSPSVGPAVFCGLGLTLGLLGVAAGTFFLVKGNQCQ